LKKNELAEAVGKKHRSVHFLKMGSDKKKKHSSSHHNHDRKKKHQKSNDGDKKISFFKSKFLKLSISTYTL
jgi:hypothetical protein